MSRTRTAEDEACGGKCIKEADKYADKITIHNACFDDRLNESYELGIVSKLEALPGGFKQQAGDAFAAGKDELARVYRDLANNFEAVGKAERAAWTKKYKAK